MGSGGNQTSTTSAPSWAVPYQENYLGGFANLLTPGAQYQSAAPQPLQQVAPFSPSQQAAMNYVQGQGPQNPVAQSAANLATNTMGGGYLGPNPYLNQYYNQAAQGLTSNYQTATSPDITAQAVQHGALGGSGQQQESDLARFDLGSNLAQLGAQIYEPAYQFERGQQTAALGQAPSTIGAGYIAPQMMMGTGGMQQTQLQNILNTGGQNLNQQGMWPYQNASMQGQSFAPITGGQQVISGVGGMK